MNRRSEARRVLTAAREGRDLSQPSQIAPRGSDCLGGVTDRRRDVASPAPAARGAAIRQHGRPISSRALGKEAPLRTLPASGRDRDRLRGCLLAALALVLMVAVAILVVWPLAVRPFLRDAARDRVRDEVAAAVAAARGTPRALPGADRRDRSIVVPATPPVPGRPAQARAEASAAARSVPTVTSLPARQLVVTEADLSAYLRADADGILDDPSVAITADRVRLSFSFFGLDNAFSGRLAVRDGRLVVLDADLSGPVGSVFTEDEAADLVEEQLTALLAGYGLRPTTVHLRDGALVVTAAPDA